MMIAVITLKCIQIKANEFIKKPIRTSIIFHIAKTLTHIGRNSCFLIPVKIILLSFKCFKKCFKYDQCLIESEYNCCTKYKLKISNSIKYTIF